MFTGNKKDINLAPEHFGFYSMKFSIARFFSSRFVIERLFRILRSEEFLSFFLVCKELRKKENSSSSIFSHLLLNIVSNLEPNFRDKKSQRILKKKKKKKL